jgi:hypothetical protein
MYMLIVIFYAFVNLLTPDQPKWEELSAFEIYPKISISKFHELSDADIKKLPFKSTDLKEAKKLLSAAKQQFTPILWKGMGRLAIAKFKDGSSRRILINTYSSSFTDATGKKSYHLEDHASAWRKFIDKNIPSEKNK